MEKEKRYTGESSWPVEGERGGVGEGERERENRPPPLILPSVSLCRTIVLE